MKRRTGNRKSTYFEGDSDKQFNIESMKKYVIHKQELDKRLEELIAPIMTGGSPRVADACCGIGHLVYLLHERFPNATFTGFDETPYLIEQAKELTKGMDRVQFEVQDLYRLPKSYTKAFDIAICWKTLSWLPSYEEAMRVLMDMARAHIFVSSLFYDGDIEFEIKVRQYVKEQDSAHFYNIYSLPRFDRFVRSLGAKKVEAVNFEIGIDLPRGDINHMGTYTIPLKNGGRMQMSGALAMSWKIIHIEL
jgi:ubiquinone/menaquinone biosynthesis C-methylase UbiE